MNESICFLLGPTTRPHFSGPMRLGITKWYREPYSLCLNHQLCHCYIKEAIGDTEMSVRAVLQQNLTKLCYRLPMPGLEHGGQGRVVLCGWKDRNCWIGRTLWPLE